DPEIASISMPDSATAPRSSRRASPASSCVRRASSSSKSVARPRRYADSAISRNVPSLPQALERRAPRAQHLEVALELGAQAGFDRALAAARRRGLRPRLVLLRAPGVEDRDLARYAEEVRRAEGPAGPGAPDADARHGKALALGELDARLRGARLGSGGLQRRAPVKERVGVHRRRRPQRLQRALRLRPPASGAGERGERRGLLGDLGLRFLHPDRSERALGVGAREVVAAR